MYRSELIKILLLLIIVWLDLRHSYKKEEVYVPHCRLLHIGFTWHNNPGFLWAPVLDLILAARAYYGYNWYKTSWYGSDLRYVWSGCSVACRFYILGLRQPLCLLCINHVTLFRQPNFIIYIMLILISSNKALW